MLTLWFLFEYVKFYSSMMPPLVIVMFCLIFTFYDSVKNALYHFKPDGFTLYSSRVFIQFFIVNYLSLIAFL